MSGDTLLPRPDIGLTVTQASRAGQGQAIRTLAAQKDSGKIDEAAREFEAVFIAEMMKPMFEGISTDGMFGGGKGEEIFRGMLLQEYGKILAQTGGIGISAPVREEMIRMQEQRDNQAGTITEGRT